jgi:uncharacterized NAD(P)/FAD-binding protein YdhS
VCDSGSRTPTATEIAIVGAGASGILLASALKRRDAALDVTLIDPAPGRGVAYGDPQPHNLLNTRVGNMSLDPHGPEAFLEWLDTHRPRLPGWTTEDFAPRSYYGDYLGDRLAALRTGAFSGTRVRLIHSRANSAELSGAGWSIRLASGERVSTRILVLATGWARPRPLHFRGRETIEDLVQDDPWDSDALAELPAAGEVLLVGAGLTALDVAAAIWRRAPGLRVNALSRHGMLPRVHASPLATSPVLKPPYPKTARELYAKLRAVAEFSEGDGSLRHGVFLGLRNVAAEIWEGLAEEERRMFLRHFRRYWDIERHRTPPEQAEIIERATAEGRFRLIRGRLSEAAKTRTGAGRLLISTSGEPLTLDVHRVINCTGPEQSALRSRNALLLDLLAQGHAAPDPLGLGLEVDGAGALLSGRGQPSPALYALGPPTQGRFFEITGVPEIRTHAERLATTLAAAMEGGTAPPLAAPHARAS